MKLHASVLAAALAAGARAQTVKVHVDTSKPRHTVAHPFLGVSTAHMSDALHLVWFHLHVCVVWAVGVRETAEAPARRRVERC